jgi:Tfp pilus assembly protein PilF
MRLNQFGKALKSFSECISIDETQGEAWGNMASCYMYEKKPKEAYSTLSQAVKYSEGNWKLWANLLTVSLSLKKFYKFFESI